MMFDSLVQRQHQNFFDFFYGKQRYEEPENKWLPRGGIYKKTSSDE